MKRSSRTLVAGLVPMIFFAAIAACSSTDGGMIDDVPETGADAMSDATQRDGSPDDATTDQKAQDASDAGKDADASDDDADSGEVGDGGNDADADNGDPNDAGNGAEPVCQDERQTCKTTDDCCPGLECGGDGFVLECVPVAAQCVKEGGDCGGAEPCCDGLTCNASNHCEVPAPVCRQERETCNNTTMLCCPGLECGGDGIVPECVPVAAQCVKDGGDCGDKDVCCDGLTCNANGKCEVPAPVCIAEGQLCNKPGDVCCPGLYCKVGFLMTCDPE